MRNHTKSEALRARAQLLAGIINESEFHEMFGFGGFGGGATATAADHTDLGPCTLVLQNNRLSVQQDPDEDFFGSLTHKHANFEIDLDDEQVDEFLSYVGDDYRRYERRMHAKHGVPFSHRMEAKLRLEGDKLLIDDGFSPCVGYHCELTLRPDQVARILK